MTQSKGLINLTETIPKAPQTDENIELRARLPTSRWRSIKIIRLLRPTASSPTCLCYDNSRKQPLSSAATDFILPVCIACSAFPRSRAHLPVRGRMRSIYDDFNGIIPVNERSYIAVGADTERDKPSVLAIGTCGGKEGGGRDWQRRDSLEGTRTRIGYGKSNRCRQKLYYKQCRWRLRRAEPLASPCRCCRRSERGRDPGCCFR